MKKLALASAAALALLLMSQREASAQYVTYYSPVVAPVPTVVYRPAPVYAAPAPVVYAAPRPVVAPVAVTRTRWRPFLGGTVTRTRVGYAPVWGY